MLYFHFYSAQEFFFFLIWYSIVWSDGIWFIYSSVDGHFGLFSAFWLLWIVLLWTFMYKSLFEYLSTSFGYMYPRAAGSYSNAQSNLRRERQTVYHSNHFTFPTSSVWRMSYWLLHMENVNKGLIKLFLLHGEMTFLNRNDPGGPVVKHLHS